MGKVKNSKKYRKKLTERSNPIPTNENNNKLPEETKNLSHDIGSLDVKKRERACIILGEILANYSSNYDYFEKICNSDILGKLCMRLVDSNLNVRLHAAGAVRNISSSKYPIIAKRIVDIGITSTMMTLVRDTLNNSLNETSSNYIEQLITAISNLSAACELVVNEMLQKQFLDILFRIIQSPDISPAIKSASACAIYTASDGHLECCSYIFNNSDIFPILLSTLSFSSDSNPKLALTRLYCVGSLSNIYLSFLSADSQPDVSLLTNIREKMQQVLSVVLSSLSIHDEIFLAITSISIDTSTNSTEQLLESTEVRKQNNNSNDNDDDNGDNNNNNNNNGDNDEMEGGGKADKFEDKFVFLAGDVDRSWTEHFDVVEVAAEILANMACLVKNTVLTSNSNQDVEDNEEWSDNEEDEKKMEQIASSTKGNINDQTNNQSNFNDFDTQSSINSCISFIEKIDLAFNNLISHAQAGEILTSPVIELLVSADRIFSALHNISFLIDSQNWTVLQFANTLSPSLQLLNSLCKIFAGITLSNQVTTTNESNLTEEESSIHMWSISPLISSQSIEVALRSTIFSCLNWILSIHSACGGNPITLGLFVEGDERFVQLKNYRLSTLLKVISDIPLFEALRSCLDIISMLAELTLPGTEKPILSPQENQILTQTLLQRLSDPGAIVSKENSIDTRTKLVDASTMVMEGCISSIIDLHSSDDLEIYQVFYNLQTLNILKETTGIFRNKLKGESNTMEKTEVQRCKETLLNLTRFIKYKSIPPK